MADEAGLSRSLDARDSTSSCMPSIYEPNRTAAVLASGRLALAVVSKNAASERCGGLPPVRLEVLGRRHRLEHVRCVP